MFLTSLIWCYKKAVAGAPGPARAPLHPLQDNFLPNNPTLTRNEATVAGRGPDAFTCTTIMTIATTNIITWIGQTHWQHWQTIFNMYKKLPNHIARHTIFFSKSKYSQKQHKKLLLINIQSIHKHHLGGTYSKSRRLRRQTLPGFY